MTRDDAKRLEDRSFEQEGLSEISFGDLLAIVKGAFLPITVMAFIGAAAAAAIAWSTTPVFQAQALLSPAGEGTGKSALSRLAGEIAPLAGMLGGDGGTGLEGRDVWIATLKSRHLAEKFIVEHNVLPNMFPKRWDAAAQQWREQDGHSMKPTMDDAFRVFRDDVLSVSEDRRTGLVSLSMESTDRTAVSNWVNEYVREANELIRARAIHESAQALEYLKQEIAKTNVAELQRAMYELVQSKISQGMLANVRKEYAFAVIDPAVTPEPDNFVRPRRAVIVVVGFLIGLLLGLGYACVKWIRRVDGAPAAR